MDAPLPVGCVVAVGRPARQVRAHERRRAQSFGLARRGVRSRRRDDELQRTRGGFPLLGYFAVAVAAWATGYIAGLGGSSLAQRSRFYPRVERWVRSWGLLTIFVLAVIPGPMFDLAGIAAGTLRVPFRRFLLACLIGKVLRFIAVAWAGHFLGTNGVL